MSFPLPASTTAVFSALSEPAETVTSSAFDDDEGVSRRSTARSSASSITSSTAWSCASRRLFPGLGGLRLLRYVLCLHRRCLFGVGKPSGSEGKIEKRRVSAGKASSRGVAATAETRAHAAEIVRLTARKRMSHRRVDEPGAPAEATMLGPGIFCEVVTEEGHHLPRRRLLVWLPKNKKKRGSSSSH